MDQHLDSGDRSNVRSSSSLARISADLPILSSSMDGWIYCYVNNIAIPNRMGNMGEKKDRIASLKKKGTEYRSNRTEYRKGNGNINKGACYNRINKVCTYIYMPYGNYVWHLLCFQQSIKTGKLYNYGMKSYVEEESVKNGN